MAIFGGVPPIVYAVDDEPDNVEFLSRALSKHYDVRSFTEPAKALETVRKVPPVGLVVDYRMPKMNGVELVRAIRQQGHKFGVVMVTAFPELDEVVYAQQANLLYRILPKPCDAKALLTHLELAIAEVLYRGAIDAYRQLSPKG
jgi:DNA-binding NtrC family response regulator